MSAEAITKKRSHEAMDNQRDTQGTQNENWSPTAPETFDTASQQIGAEHSAPEEKSITTANAMPPPPAPVSNTTSRKPSDSSEGISKSKRSRSRTEDTDVTKDDAASKPLETSAPEDTVGDDEQSVTSLDLAEPSDKIEDLDWFDLETRYHNKMRELNASERDILTEFEGLCQFFSIWAQSGSNREVDRSFKRLKTRMTLVQHHEDDLEQKRLHYIKVVDAFKTVAIMLSDPDFADVTSWRSAMPRPANRPMQTSDPRPPDPILPRLKLPTEDVPVMSTLDVHPARCAML